MNVDTPDWNPLELFFARIGDQWAEEIESFMWMYGDDEAQWYKHKMGRRHLVLGPDGRDVSGRKDLDALVYASGFAEGLTQRLV